MSRRRCEIRFWVASECGNGFLKAPAMLRGAYNEGKPQPGPRSKQHWCVSGLRVLPVAYVTLLSPPDPELCESGQRKQSRDPRKGAEL